jgi:hypothetical protein
LNFSFQNNPSYATLICCISAGIFIYFILTYLLVGSKISVPISIIIAILIFGLTRYYSTSSDERQYTQPVSPNAIGVAESQDAYNDRDKDNEYRFGIIFVGIYLLLLAICTFISNTDSHIFVSWSELNATGITQLGAAILLSFFMPGYAVVLIIAKRCKINPILKVLLAYLISILISGLIGYILALYLDIAISESKYLIIGTNLVILIAYLFSFSINRIKIKFNSQNVYHVLNFFVSFLKTKLVVFVKSKSSELLVFGSLFLLLVVSTYYLFGGVTIGDQWFHQGRALLFLSGSIKEAAFSYADPLYPPFQSAVIAILTTLSGLPLVNTYASIAFLNITYVFAFYYFFSTWMPKNMQRAKILASTLIAISSGFGWIYLLGLTVTTHPVVSQKTVLETIISIRPFDIIKPTNFFLAAHPDFSTGLIYIALPAGFVLLGLLRGNLNNNLIFAVIVTGISILGILSHDEFYLFIIISAVLPLIFRIKQGKYIYPSFLFAFLAVFIIDLVSPQRYYTSNYIFSGLSLLTLSILFVGVTWSLYLIQQNLNRMLRAIPSFFNKFRPRKTKNNSINNTRLRFVTGVFLISMLSYILGLSFIVLSLMSTEDIIIQAAGNGGPYNIPWYFYSMKLGIMGILGLVFIISYVFKKFEKEIFVFGILIVVALLAGPYYDEHRFSKYIMIGMVALASLLIYKILNNLRSKNKDVVTTIVIGAIIIVTSLSSILFIAYNYLILQTHEFVQTLWNRIFPTTSEISFFERLYDNLDIGSKRYNVLTFAREYNNANNGLMTKLQAFSGLPANLTYQNPLTLNVTTLDAFYHLLDDNGIKYIVLPKDSINKKVELKEPIRFAIEHFQRAYEDSKYIMLDVPNVISPSSSPVSDTAIIYNHNQKDEKLSSNVLGLKELQYVNTPFDIGGETSFVAIQEGNKTDKVILSDLNSTKGLTIWSEGIDPERGINYVEVGFHIVGENAKRNNDVGIKWKEGLYEEYYLSLSKDGLQLFQKSNNIKYDSKLLYQNNQIEINDRESYILKLERLQNLTKIFLNNKLRIQMPAHDSSNETDGISQVGISATNRVVEFGPIKIGNLSEQKYGGVTRYNQYYYPLSIIALSKMGYDIFLDADLSAFSKKQLVLTFDPSEWDDKTFNRYLEYVRKGGVLVVMNSDFIKGRFSKLFSLQSNLNEKEAFTSIIGDRNQSLGLYGFVNRLELNDSQDINVISTYRDKSNRIIAPFAVEKQFSNGGKILLVNSQGYFNALSKEPRQYFPSLSNISTLLGLDGGKASISETNTNEDKRFIGVLKISGNLTVNSSSFLMSDDGNNSQNIYAERIVISNKSNNQSHIFNNVTIKDLKLMGQYKVTVNSRGTSILPSKDSQHEYIGITIPTKFNITVNIYPNRSSSGEIVTVNSLSVNPIHINNDSIINFYNISTDPSQKSVPVLMKSPEIKLNGHVGFNNSNFDQYFINTDIPLDGEGELNAKINFVDNYEQRNVNTSSKLQYLTYLQSITIDEGINRGKVTLNLPGDISEHLKKYGPRIPLREALFSGSNAMLLISVAVVTLIGSWLIWPKLKRRMSQEHT